MVCSKKAFTLIEVMVAVMIVSVVIAALFKLRGDSSHLLTKIQAGQKYGSLSTFLLWNKKYGMNKSHTTLYYLVEDFDLDDDLRRELKTRKVDISYKRLGSMELETMTLELGATELSGKNFDTLLQRVTIE